MAGGELALDRVAGDDRIVDQQAERDDQRGDRDLLQVDAEQVHHAERHRQRDRDRQRHQQRRAPLPEADQRDEDDQDDRLVEAAHEQVDVLADLPRLIGRPREDRDPRAAAPAARPARASTAAPNSPICAPARICTASVMPRRALPVAVRVRRAVVVQERRRALVAARRRRRVAQVDRRCRCASARARRRSPARS